MKQEVPTKDRPRSVFDRIFRTATEDDPSILSPLEKKRGEILGSSADLARMAHNWERIDERIFDRKRLRNQWKVLRIPAFAMVFGAALFSLLTLQPLFSSPQRQSAEVLRSGPLLLDDGSAIGRVELSMADRGEAFHFREGSQIDLSPGSSLIPARNSASEMIFDLERGRARFSITPGGPRRWIVRTPKGSVEVLGTIFVVEVLPNGFSVRVERGKVEAKPLPSFGRLNADGSTLVVDTLQLTAGMEESFVHLEEEFVEPRLAATSGVDSRPAPSSGVAARLAATAQEEVEARIAVTASALLDQSEAAMREGREDEAMQGFERILLDASAFEEQRYARLYLAEIYAHRNHANEVLRLLPETLIATWPLTLFERGYGLVLAAHLSEGDQSEYCASHARYLRRAPEGLHASESSSCP